MPFLDMNERFKQRAEQSARRNTPQAIEMQQAQKQQRILEQEAQKGSQDMARQQEADRAAMERTREQQAGEMGRAQLTYGPESIHAKTFGAEYGPGGLKERELGVHERTARTQEAYRQAQEEHGIRQDVLRASALRTKAVEDWDKKIAFGANSRNLPGFDDAAFKSMKPNEQNAYLEKFKQRHVEQSLHAEGVNPAIFEMAGSAPPRRYGGEGGGTGAQGAAPEQPQGVIVRMPDGSFQVTQGGRIVGSARPSQASQEVPSEGRFARTVPQGQGQALEGIQQTPAQASEAAPTQKKFSEMSTPQLLGAAARKTGAAATQVGSEILQNPLQQVGIPYTDINLGWLGEQANRGAGVVGSAYRGAKRLARRGLLRYVEPTQ